MIYAVNYMRLSKEDEREGESGSISNQRKIIESYCAQHGITLVDEFVDDDYSGGNFNRPGFQKMICYLKTNSHVKTVITKDLSRLGRDMSESSYYAERYFPEHNIRYLAIDDSFDSETDNMLAPFQFAMNDMYIRDVSKKVKNSMHMLMDRGEYCFMAPYGYRKDPEDIHHLVPDEKTAPVIASIFDMASHGKSVDVIAKKLTEQGVSPPLKYRVTEFEGEKSGNSKFASDEWNSMTVRRILKNPVYLGHTLLGKTKKVSPKSDVRRRLPKSDWRITENTHQPLVDEQTFELASSGLKARSNDYRQYEHVRKSIFSGIVFCATCGAAMCSSGTVYNGERERYWYLTCQNIPARSKHKCPNGARIKYSTLIDVVSQDLRGLLALSDDQRKEIAAKAVERERTSTRASEEEKKICTANDRLKTIEQIISKLYEDMYTGAVPRDRAMSMLQKYEDETKALNEQITESNKTIAVIRDVAGDYQKFFGLIDQVTDFECLNRNTLCQFVERIEVGPRKYPDGKRRNSRSKDPYEQDIKIVYRFIGDEDFAEKPV